MLRGQEELAIDQGRLENRNLQAPDHVFQLQRNGRVGKHKIKHFGQCIHRAAIKIGRPVNFLPVEHLAQDVVTAGILAFLDPEQRRHIGTGLHFTEVPHELGVGGGISRLTSAGGCSFLRARRTPAELVQKLPRMRGNTPSRGRQATPFGVGTLRLHGAKIGLGVCGRLFCARRGTRRGSAVLGFLDAMHGLRLDPRLHQRVIQVRVQGSEIEAVARIERPQQVFGGLVVERAFLPGEQERANKHVRSKWIAGRGGRVQPQQYRQTQAQLIHAGAIVGHEPLSNPVHQQHPFHLGDVNQGHAVRALTVECVVERLPVETGAGNLRQNQAQLLINRLRKGGFKGAIERGRLLVKRAPGRAQVFGLGLRRARVNQIQQMRPYECEMVILMLRKVSQGLANQDAQVATRLDMGVTRCGVNGRRRTKGHAGTACSL